MLLSQIATVALAVNTEKAKSEFIIAPILLEVRRLCRGAVGLFSGVALDVEPAKGLNGVCDFLLTKTAHQFILSAPVVTVVEAKNDNLRNGLGQCIATTYAATLYNQRAGSPIAAVCGVVTTGSAWKFLRLEGMTVTIDLKEYYIDKLEKLVGVLTYIVQNASYGRVGCHASHRLLEGCREDRRSGHRLWYTHPRPVRELGSLTISCDNGGELHAL